MRVYDQPDRRVLGISIDQGPQHPRRGRDPTRTGVVLGIGNHHRPLPCPFCRAGRIGNRRVGGKCIIVELGFGSGIGIRHRICCGIRRRLSLGIGHRRGATIGNIRRRKAHEQRRRQCALRLNLCQVFIQSLGGLHIRRLKRDRHQIGHAAERFGRARAGLHHMIQQPRRCGTGIGHIDVRIGAESRQHIHRVHKLFRDIAMQVQCGGNRHIRPHQCAHLTGDLALPVIVMRRHHRAVQVQKHTIQRPCGT